MSEDSNVEKIKWTCEIPTIEKDVSWTVGGKHTLSCRGESVSRLQEPIKIVVQENKKVVKADKDPNTFEAKTNKDKKTDPNKDYALVILKTKNIDNDSGDFEITSYKPGKYNGVTIKLVGNNKKEISVNPMTWEVSSVLTKENGKGFGPTAPFSLGLPWFYWLSIIVTVVVIVSLIGAKVLLVLKKQVQTKKMKSYMTALGSVNQFYKDLRDLHSHYKNMSETNPVSLSSMNEYWLALEEKFKLYIVRQFEVPAYDLSNSQIINKVKKKSKANWNAKLHGKLQRVLAEFRKGTQAKALNLKDVSQMEKLCQEFVEQVKKQIDKRRLN